MVNVTSRITLACVLVLLVQQASAETVLERSNRILQEINERVVNQYRAPAPNVTALPQPATTANPEDVAKQFHQQPLQTKLATPEMMIFVSFSMPRESLLRIVEQSEKTGARLIFRGFKGDKMTDMSKRISALLGNHRVEAVIHPPAFTQFKVNQVPALVLAQSDVGDQLDSGCAQPDRYVKVTGDVSQDYALEYIERTSPQWAVTARLFGDKVKVDHP
ncbi:Conjugal transfer pilus assembly protein TrbC [Candidatus Nitrotoga sp. HW29]|uniref:type-F conjugative transfer system pilin assembly protein TrbC n=2 Tax=Candidatus Nitrotoga sp. HW29 TaxID=2886963 RepID=UPI001EF3202C|nr:type-F conjugative transfer system pilin assembly protein TrbC [Candidatus Nitrotoga sp. HW29]CAH1905048.1 Conjugal transfer pilus assembly protein TrbC [Candidatus Nitrotoga sp. HW29]